MTTLSERSPRLSPMESYLSGTVEEKPMKGSLIETIGTTLTDKTTIALDNRARSMDLITP